MLRGAISRKRRSLDGKLWGNCGVKVKGGSFGFEGFTVID